MDTCPSKTNHRNSPLVPFLLGSVPLIRGPRLTCRRLPMEKPSHSKKADGTRRRVRGTSKAKAKLRLRCKTRLSMWGEWEPIKFKLYRLRHALFIFACLKLLSRDGAPPSAGPALLCVEWSHGTITYLSAGGKRSTVPPPISGIPPTADQFSGTQSCFKSLPKRRHFRHQAGPSVRKHRSG